MNAAEGRVRKLRERIAAEGIDALLIASGTNRRYVTGFTGTAGYAVVSSDQAWLFTDFRYMTQAKAQAPWFQLVEHDAKPLPAIRETLQSAGIARLGFEQQHVSYGSYVEYGRELAGAIQLIPTEGIVERLRQIKDADEIAVIRQAVAIGDAAFDHILGVIRPGLSEQEVALELEMFMRRQGASGRRSAPNFE